MTSIRLATRGSPLALWQAETVASMLRSTDSSLDVRLEIVKTSGDVVLDRPIPELGATGVFTKEVDRRVVEGRADAAVHSLKDLATVLETGLVLGAHLPRGPVEDVLVAPIHRTLDALPKGAVVATGSLRRRAMLLRARPDLVVVGSRGNVATRIAKADGVGVHATVLARAGLMRLDAESAITEVLPTSLVLPAVGQAIVAVTCRGDDLSTCARLAAIDDPVARACAAAERALLRALRAGCHAPVGGFAVVVDGVLRLEGRVLDANGSQSVEGLAVGSPSEAESIGERLAEDMARRGAARLLGGPAS